MGCSAAASGPIPVPDVVVSLAAASLGVSPMGSCFIDLSRMLGQPTPAEADPEGDFYTFERGIAKTGAGGGGRKGFAGVWHRGHFAFEYKGKHKDLKAAYEQLLL